MVCFMLWALESWSCQLWPNVAQKIFFNVPIIQSSNPVWRTLYKMSLRARARLAKKEKTPKFFSVLYISFGIVWKKLQTINKYRRSFSTTLIQAISIVTLHSYNSQLTRESHVCTRNENRFIKIMKRRKKKRIDGSTSNTHRLYYNTHRSTQNWFLLILIMQRAVQLEKSNENPKAVPKEEVRNV